MIPYIKDLYACVGRLHEQSIITRETKLNMDISALSRQMNVAISNTIKNSLEPSLRDMSVPLHFIKLDLGNVPLKTDNMLIHRVDLEPRGAHDDGVEQQAGIQVDFNVSWDGNCDIMMQATMSKSMKVTLGVKHIKLHGRMHVLLSPLTSELPVVSAVQYGFTNPPKVELKLTGAVQVVTKFFPAINSALIGVIQSVLASTVVLPHRMLYPVDTNYDYMDAYQPPVGMVRVRAVRAHGFKVLQKRILRDIPDVYCVISLGASSTFRPNFRTRTKVDDLTPDWSDESCDFILFDMDQEIRVQVWDEDVADTDTELGRAEISVRDLLRNKGSAELELELKGKATGCFVAISAELFHLSTRLDSMSSPDYGEKDQLCGLATIIVSKASNIPIFPRGDVATFVKVLYGEGTCHKKTFQTGVVADYPGVDAINPMYDSVFHVPIHANMLQQENNDQRAPRRGSSANSLKLSKMPSLFHTSSSSMGSDSPNDIVFILVHSNGLHGSKGSGELGRMVVTHESLIAALNHTITETRPIGNCGAKLEFRVSLNGMQSEKEKLLATKAPQSIKDEKFTTPRSLYGGMENMDGVNIRVTVLRGRGFKIRKHMIQKNDVPDVYCAIELNSYRNKGGTPNQPWRTLTIKDDTMPQWNQSSDYNNVDPSRDSIRVGAYDENKGKDEYLGAAYFSIEKLLRKRQLEAELQKGSKATGGYVTLVCVRIEEERTHRCDAGVNSLVDNGEVAVHFHPQLGDEGIEATRLNGQGGSGNVLSDDDFDEGEDGDVVPPLTPTAALTPPQITDLHLVSNNGRQDGEDQSVNSTSSTSSLSSISRKMRKKAGKISKSFKLSSRKKKGQ